MKLVSSTPRPVHFLTAGMAAWLALASPAAGTNAQQDDPVPISVETLCQGLSYPCGVAVHPQSEMPVVSNSGAGTIVGIVDGVAHDLINGFEQGQPGPEFPGVSGPLGIDIMQLETGSLALVVGTGGLGPGVDRIAVYPLSGDGMPQIDSPVSAATERFSRTLNEAGGRVAEHFFYGVASFGEVVWFSCRGDVTAGWIGRFEMYRGEAGKCQRWIPSAEQIRQTCPIAVSVSPDGFLVVANGGDPDSNAVSVIGFYDMESGGLRGRFETELDNIVALAWSPTTGQLYALDYSRRDPAHSGLYRLIATDRNRTCRAERVLSIPCPTAMAFTRGGQLLVTSLGDPLSDNSGQLLKISGLEEKGPANPGDGD